jgi:hypothetical protein
MCSDLLTDTQWLTKVLLAPEAKLNAHSVFASGLWGAPCEASAFF